MLINISITPRQEGGRGVGEDSGLVEADAGYIGGFDGVGMVVLLFGEGEGQVLDAVGHAEFFEEQDEFTSFGLCHSFYFS